MELTGREKMRNWVVQNLLPSKYGHLTASPRRDQEYSAATDSLHVQIEASAPHARSVFALACAERLVAADSSSRRKVLQEALDAGWAAVLEGSTERLSILESIDGREDIDDDAVAGVAHALMATSGASEHATAVSTRATDAAFEQVPYPDDASSFRELDDDFKTEVVQREYRWQKETLMQLAKADDLSQVIQQLRR